MKKRILATLLLLALLLPTFAACGDNKKPDTTTDPVNTDDTSATEEEYKLPEFDFEGHEVNILTAARSISRSDFLYDENTPTVLDAAIERRNRAVEQLYDITITTEMQFTTANQQSPQAYRRLVQDATSGDYTYDFCVIPGYDVSQLAYEGYLSDLNAMPFFDGTKSWYDQNANETFEFADALFFTTGSANVDMMDQTYCIAFNKELAAKYGLEDFYELVKNYEWTIDRMYKIAKEVADDTDGDGRTDVYGIYYWVDAVYGMVNAAGQRMVTLNKDTNTYDLTINTEVTANMLERFCNIVFDSDTSKMYQHNSANKEYIEVFSGDKALFFLTTIGLLSNFRDMETDYGILPYVLYNEEQTRYYNTVAPFYMTYMCVPLMVEDEERTSAILEAIGYYSEEYIIPAYYEKTLHGQYTRDEASSEMLDLIFDTRCYDLGYCYQPANLNKNLIYMLQSGNYDWASRYASLETPAKTALAVISEAYRSAVGIK